MKLIKYIVLLSSLYIISSSIFIDLHLSDDDVDVTDGNLSIDVSESVAG